MYTVYCCKARYCVSVIMGLCAFSEFNAILYRSSVTTASLGMSEEDTSSIDSILLNHTFWLKERYEYTLCDWRNRDNVNNKMDKN